MIKSCYLLGKKAYFLYFYDNVRKIKELTPVWLDSFTLKYDSNHKFFKSILYIKQENILTQYSWIYIYGEKTKILKWQHQIHIISFQGKIFERLF